EYVEIKNTSDKYLNLQNWQIVDNTPSHKATISAKPVVLHPHSFLVLSRDTTVLYDIYGPRHYLQSPVPALNNSGDAIKIFARNNILTDSLNYTPGWGGKKVALERISGTIPAIYKENFDDSPNPLGGTPGMPNEVAPDTVPPLLTDLLITDNQTLTLVFSERLKYNQAANAGNYIFNHGIHINNVRQMAPDSVQLQLATQ